MKVNRIIFILVILAYSTTFAGEKWQNVMPGVKLNFPRDHGSHPETRTEWWYVTGQVKNELGRRFGFQFTIFRNGVIAGPAKPDESALKARQVLAGHFAIADIQTQQFLQAQRLHRIGAGYAWAAQEMMHLWIGDWEIRMEEDGHIILNASDYKQNISIDFELEIRKPLVLQGENGYSAKGEEPGNASIYTSFTRLTTKGKLTVPDGTFRVTGTSWFDHEYGTSQLGEDVTGWDWFGLHLDDGRDLMVYQLRSNKSGATKYSSGMIVDRNGASIRLTYKDYTLARLDDTWTSSNTGGIYPIAWRLEIPAHGITCKAQALLPASEMSTKDSTGVVYWEGPVQLNGKTPGYGYLEMTGYIDSLKTRF